MFPGPPTSPGCPGSPCRREGEGRGREGGGKGEGRGREGGGKGEGRVEREERIRI